MWSWCCLCLYRSPSCADLFHPRGRHFVSGSFITVMSFALIIVEHYNSSPTSVGYWLRGTCILLSIFVLALGIFGLDKIFIACLFNDALAFIISIPVLNTQVNTPQWVCTVDELLKSKPNGCKHVYQLNMLHYAYTYQRLPLWKQLSRDWKEQAGTSSFFPSTFPVQ